MDGKIPVITMNDLEYSPEVVDAWIDAIPENPYNPCPCGCGKKWRFVLTSTEVKEHMDRFAVNHEKQNQ